MNKEFTRSTKKGFEGRLEKTDSFYFVLINTYHWIVCNMI